MNTTQKLKLRYVVKQKLGDCCNSLAKVGRLGEWPDKVGRLGEWPDQSGEVKLEAFPK